MSRSFRTRNASSTQAGMPLDAILAPMSKDELEDWKGWCELESDPQLFQTMLQEIGTSGITAQEVITLDTVTVSKIPRPIYGLIFLFRIEEGVTDQQQEASCPSHVWFANQTTSNACASVALMNVLMNVDDSNIEFGPELNAFKDHTSAVSPSLRGECIANFDFLRNKHNAFARKMDVLNADLCLSHSASGRRSYSKASKTDEVEAFHFVSYIPIQGEIWRLDGLNRQPVKIGPIQDDWVPIAMQVMAEQMSKASILHCNIVAICKPPPTQASIRQAIRVLEERLDLLVPEWRSFATIAESSGEPGGLDETLPPDVQTLLEREDVSPEEYLQKYEDCVHEVQLQQHSEPYYQQDYTLFLHKWMTMLAEKRALRDLTVS